MVLVISILMVFSVRFAETKFFKPDQQAQLVIDAFKEARARSINQQETMRVEISQTFRMIRLITENEPGDASDDVLMYELPLARPYEVVFDDKPNNTSGNPQEPTPVPIIKFRAKHLIDPTQTSNDQVATFRFLKNGNVVDAGLNAAGDGAVVSGVTIYFWTPIIDQNGAATKNGQVLRALTMLGNSGTTRYWKCPVKDAFCTKWEK